MSIVSLVSLHTPTRSRLFCTRQFIEVNASIDLDHSALGYGNSSILIFTDRGEEEEQRGVRSVRALTGMNQESKLNVSPRTCRSLFRAMEFIEVNTPHFNDSAYTGVKHSFLFPDSSLIRIKEEREGKGEGEGAMTWQQVENGTSVCLAWSGTEICAGESAFVSILLRNVSICQYSREK